MERMEADVCGYGGTNRSVLAALESIRLTSCRLCRQTIMICCVMTCWDAICNA